MSSVGGLEEVGGFPGERVPATPGAAAGGAVRTPGCVTDWKQLTDCHSPPPAPSFCPHGSCSYVFCRRSFNAGLMPFSHSACVS